MSEETVQYTQEESDLLNTYRALRALCDMTRGSLWWVRERIWEKNLGSRYKRPKKERQGHFGLNIRMAPPESPYEQMPMLHGTSGRKGPVVAKGLSTDTPPDYCTSFGHLGPAEMKIGDFRSQGIQPNRHKPRLDSGEMAVLSAWLEKRGLA